MIQYKSIFDIYVESKRYKMDKNMLFVLSDPVESFPMPLIIMYTYRLLNKTCSIELKKPYKNPKNSTSNELNFKPTYFHELHIFSIPP